MKPGDFSKYAVAPLGPRVQDILVDRVRRALGPRSIHQGRLLPPGDMSMDVMEHLLSRQGVGMTRSRFPGAMPTSLHKGLPEKRVSKYPASWRTKQEGHGEAYWKGLSEDSMHPLKEFDLGVQDQSIGRAVDARRKRLMELGRRHGMELPEPETAGTQLQRYLYHKPYAFEDSALGQAMMGKMRQQGRTSGSGWRWTVDKYRTTPSSIAVRAPNHI